MKNKILFIASLLFGLMFINSGLNKFLHYIPMPKDLPEGLVKITDAFMSVSWLMPLIGIIEIIGGILFITKKYRALSALIILPVVVGVLLTHIFNAPSGFPIAIILFAINIWVIYENREKYMPMIS